MAWGHVPDEDLKTFRHRSRVRIETNASCGSSSRRSMVQGMVPIPNRKSRIVYSRRWLVPSSPQTMKLIRERPLAIGEVHHHRQQNIDQRVLATLTRERNNELKNKRSIGKDPDQAVGTGHIDINHSGETENKKGVGNDHCQEEKVVQQMRRKDFKGDPPGLGAKQSGRCFLST